MVPNENVLHETILYRMSTCNHSSEREEQKTVQYVTNIMIQVEYRYV
jgi:hypothetical protein